MERHDLSGCSVDQKVEMCIECSVEHLSSSYPFDCKCFFSFSRICPLAISSASKITNEIKMAI